MKVGPLKLILLILGWFFVGLGVVGIWLPVLPTTPFFILAAYLFSKSSDRLHQWLLNLPKIGIMIKDWEQKGVIRFKAKILSTAMIIPLFSYTLFFVQVSIPIKVIILIIGVIALSFIWTRPSN